MPTLTNEMAQILAAIIIALAALIGTIITVRAQHSRKPSGLPTHTAEKKDRLDTILSTHAIRVGVVKHPPLCNFEWKNGIPQFDGWYVKLCELVCKENELSLYLVPVEWGDIPGQVFTNMGLDVVLSVFATGLRSERADFTACFHCIDITGITRADNPKVRSVDDLAKDDVCIVVTKGEAGWEYVFNDLRIPKYRVIVVETDDITKMMDYVLDGNVDVAICDKVSCYNYSQAHPEIQTVFFADHIYTCRNCIMIPKNEPKLREWVQREFTRARRTKEIQDAEQVFLLDPRKLIRKFS